MKHETSFTDKVYEVVKKIPKGSFLTYKEVAKKNGLSSGLASSWQCSEYE